MTYQAPGHFVALGSVQQGGQALHRSSTSRHQQPDSLRHTRYDCQVNSYSQGCGRDKAALGTLLASSGLPNVMLTTTSAAGSGGAGARGTVEFAAGGCRAAWLWLAAASLRCT